tara:strand:+ start:834 stop:986 length:153 start_codon:yes stop_codon:yes gene_type:complete
MSRAPRIVLLNVFMVEEGGVAPPSAEPYLGFIEYIYYTFESIYCQEVFGG